MTNVVAIRPTDSAEATRPSSNGEAILPGLRARMFQL